MPEDSLDHLADLKGRLRSYREGIAHYLDRVISENNGFPARTFYGESFAYWLLGLSGEEYRASLDKLISIYAAKIKKSPEFHWEFNKYAWISVLISTGDSEIRDFALPLRFKCTPVTNWVLLRCCTQIMARHEVDQALQDVRSVLNNHQRASGFIYDDHGVRSLQYHCFSSVLVAEISLLCDDTELRRKFVSAANFIKNLVLNTGDTLYVGRGQQQSFGYGALIYLMALAGFLLKDFRFFRKLERCVSFLSNFRRRDGSFPLVLNDVEKGYTATTDPANPLYPGWYAYNNYFDYLPFLGVMLAKAENILSATVDASKRTSGESFQFEDDLSARYQDADFLVVRRPDYEATLARPGGFWKGGGFWTNDLPLPYIVCRKKRITPSYGGEQYGRTLFSPRGIPLPLVQFGKELTSIRDGRIWSFWRGDMMIVLTPKAVLARLFVFGNMEVVVRDILISPFKTHLYYLFENILEIRQGYEFSISHGARVVSDRHLCVDNRKQYFWGGELTALRSSAPSRTNTLTISLEAVI